jgi:hypothetical protein
MGGIVHVIVEEGEVFFWPEEGGGEESLSFSAGEGGWEVNGLGIDLKYGS